MKRRDKININTKNRIKDLMGLPESITSDEHTCSNVVNNCLRCAFADNEGKELQNNEVACCMAYDIRTKIDCPFRKFGGRESYRKGLYSIVEDEKTIIEEFYHEALELLLYGWDAEDALMLAISRIKREKKQHSDY